MNKSKVSTGELFAYLSLALGILSFPFPLVGFLAVLLGLIARKQVQSTSDAKKFRAIALIGIIAGLVAIFSRIIINALVIFGPSIENFFQDAVLKINKATP